MKNMFARRLIAGLAGAGLAIGGLVAPAALPQAMAGDIIVDLTPPVLAQITWATTLAQGATGTLDVKAGSTWDDATYTTEAIVDGGPPVGTATLDAGGTLTFTPDPDFAGLATIRYSITDQVGQTATQTVTVRVAAKPTLSASPLTGATALEGSTAEFVNQLATDTTSGAMPATCNIVSTPASAATVSNSGVVNYQNAVQGDYTFAVTCTDSLGQTTNEVVNTLLVHSVSVDIETTVARTTVFVGDPQAGDEIAWTYTVTNRGTATLTGLVITPSLPDIGTVTCDKTSLTPTSPVAICQATSTLTQDQVDAKKVEDQAVVTVMASGETFGNGAIEFSSPLTTLTVQPLSSLSITKTASLADTNGNGKADPGEVVTFTIVVTNTSDMPLTAVGVTDSWPDLKLTCDQPNGLGGLYPTDQMTCTATHTVTAQEVIAGGTLTNTATATGVDEVGYTRESVGEATVLLNHLTPPALAQISWDTPLTQGGSVAIDVKTGSTWDDNATYTTEAIVDGDAAVGTASLDASTGVLTFTPDASFSGEATIHYTITDQAGQSSTATVTVTVAGAPTLAAATPDTQTVLVGQTAVFNNTITVDETVGVTPAGCTIVSGPDGATVSPDAVVSYTATDPGEFEIVFSCQDSLGQQTPEVTNKVHVPATGLDLQVSAELTTGDPDKPMAGDVVTWTYTVTNTGSDMESGLVIVPGSTAVSNLTCPIDALAGGESTICTGTMTLTQQDIDAGMVALFEAQAKDVAYSDIESLDLISNYVTMSFELTQVGSSTTSLTATLDDTNGNGLGDPGETITYETVVENTGNVTLRDVQVTSDTLVCQPVDLAPGEQTTCVGQYEITIADVNNSKTLTDTAQSTASTPGGQTVTSSSQ
ncbi:MAG: cadherin-like domain-containing protein, partial [Propionibacteriaceae bacterium]|nr:cadherin-like domain-containing protein [Propionibacteriaceae bacterium]